MTDVTVEPASRVKRLPESYVFGKVARAKAAAKQAGLEIIDFGIGDPDRGTPDQIVDSMAQLAQHKANHRYPDTEGSLVYRKAWADLYARDWGVTLDPETQVHHLIGGKEGICHFPLAFVNRGDPVICPDPAYPVYDEGTILADGEPHYMPLLAENGFLIDLDAIPEGIAKRSRIIWVNSPGNPTGAVAPLAYFEDLVKWAKIYDVIVCSDATYSHINGGAGPTPSFLQAEGAMEVGVEFHSVSKSFSATGFRTAVMVGNADIIKPLHRVKSTIDSGGSLFIQLAFAAHLLGSDDDVRAMNADLTQKRRLTQAMLSELGFNLADSDASFYVWAKNPPGFEDSEAFSYDLIEQEGVVSVPGKGLGRMTGEGYSRWSVAAISTDDIELAYPRIARYLEPNRK